MLRLHQLTLRPDDAQGLDDALLRRLCAKRLKVKEERIRQVRLQKRSVDARGREGVHFTLTADVLLASPEAEEKLAAAFKPNLVAYLPKRTMETEPDVFALPLLPWAMERPVVVGAGPAGLFCALALAVRGARPVLLERGQPVESRTRDVEKLEATGQLNPESNVLFGEGGAGAFSDGKLTCGLNSPHIRTVLETLCAMGAPGEIRQSAKPHIGTDELRKVLVNIRRALLDLGAEVRFGCCVTGLDVQNGHVCAVRCGDSVIPTRHVFLAIGHSARDTYEWLHRLGLPMQAKPFAVGVRIEHLQKAVNKAQYGADADHPALTPAEYKLNVHTPDKRGVYTFCMCPGGQVINASGEAGGINVNGMSLHARNGTNSNAALLVGVNPADFGDDHPLSGIRFQRQMEEAAYGLTGSLAAPCQRVGDFLAQKPTTQLGGISPTYRPGVFLGDVSACLPPFVADNLRFALPRLGGMLRGFDHPDALLTAPETRSSAPVRLLRNERRESAIGGLYPLGEGAGYAGGIISAAVDGLCAAMEVTE